MFQINCDFTGLFVCLFEFFSHCYFQGVTLQTVSDLLSDLFVYKGLHVCKIFILPKSGD